MRINLFKLINVLMQKTIALIAFFILWEIAPRLGWINKSYLPTFSSVVDALINLVVSGKLFIHVDASLSRIFWGLVPAGIIAIILGFAIGSSKECGSNTYKSGKIYASFKYMIIYKGDSSIYNP